MGQQPALVVPDELFGGEPARPLHIAALDLPDVERGVQARAGVMQDIGAQDAVFAAEPVENHFADGHAIGEIVERPAPAPDPVPGQPRCAVKAGGREAYPVLMGEPRGIGKAVGMVAHPYLAADKAHRLRRCLVIPGKECGHPLAYGIAGRPDRHPVEVAARRGGGGGGVGHLSGIGGGDPHHLEGHAEAGGGHLRHLLEEPLAHLRAAVVELDRAVAIDMHQRAGLIEMGEGEGDAELHRAERDAAPQDVVAGVPFRHRAAAGVVIGALDQCFGHLVQDEILDPLAIGGALRGCPIRVRRRLRACAPLRACALGQAGGARGWRGKGCGGSVVVDPPHLQRVETEPVRRMVDHPLDSQHPLRTAKAAKGGGRLGIGAQAVRDDARMGQVIGVVGMQHRPVCHRQR